MSVEFGNSILDALPWNEKAALQALFELHEIPQNEIINPTGPQAAHLWFPQRGIVALTMALGGKSAQVGVIGREGLLGGHHLAGDYATSLTSRAITKMQGWRIRADDFALAVSSYPAFETRCRRFIQVLSVQIAAGSVFAVHAQLNQRLSRWLLMAFDRVDGWDLKISHEALAALLGVRRPGITVGLQVLEGMKAIRSTRMSIKIESRETLTKVAGEFYGLPEAEYRRLIESGLEAAAQLRSAT